jgi:hypothetical protein
MPSRRRPADIAYGSTCMGQKMLATQALFWFQYRFSVACVLRWSLVFLCTEIHPRTLIAEEALNGNRDRFD